MAVALTDLLYAAYERRLSRRLSTRDPAPARRRDARRQPPLGQGPRPRHQGRPPGRRRQHRRLPRLVRGGPGRGRHAVAAVDRQPQPPGRRGRARCCRSSRPPSPTSPRPSAGGSTRSGRSTCCRPRPPGASRRAPTSPRASQGMTVNVAVGYGGRQEITDAVRSMLDGARRQRHDHRGARRDARRSSTSPSTSTPRASPTPTSSSAPRGSSGCPGFLLWQSAHSEFYFCEAYWPDFRHVDFLRALRAYAERNRRFGG